MIFFSICRLKLDTQQPCVNEQRYQPELRICRDVMILNVSGVFLYFTNKCVGATPCGMQVYKKVVY